MDDSTEHTIADAGFEVIKHPITHVRIHRIDGKWYVEYRRKAKWFFDGFWWFCHGQFAEYTDAYERASMLKARGYYSYIRYKSETFEL